jgi:four helix bundle protein
MTAEVLSKKQYNLEDRTFTFAQNVRSFIQSIPRNMVNQGDAEQLLRSSGSIGANYIEANESLSKKDFLMRIKISRKESKESEFWLKLIQPIPANVESTRLSLIQEATELRKIFGAILTKAV